MARCTGGSRVLASAALALVLTGAGIGGCREAPPVPDGHPNLVLVTLDTTRADHLGAYGYFRDTSPNFDELARESILFERAIVPMATTLPSHISILTAAYPLAHGVLANMQHGGSRFAQRPGLRSFATLCREAGYDTGAFVSAAPLKRDSGIDAGFDVFEEPVAIAMQRWGAITTDAALEWLASREARPFFLWVHYYDAHWPFQPPEPFSDMFRADEALEAWLRERRVPDGSMRTGVNYESTRPTIDAYDGDLRYQDGEFGRLIDALKARDDWDRTAVVVVGDHGEGLSQHGHAAHGLTWDEQLRAPLLMRVPGEAPRRVSETISVVDVLPTLLGLLEAPRLATLLEQATGRDVLAKDLESRPAFSQDSGRLAESGEYHFALTTDRWKYVVARNGGEITAERLYDLASDPHELVDVSGRHPQVLDELRVEMRASVERQHLHAAELGPAPAPRPADPGILEQLEALGYVEPSDPPQQEDAP